MTLAVGLALVVVGAGLPGRSGEMLPGRWGFLAVFPLIDAAVLAAFAFGEDSYRGNGISRWEAYRSPGGALGYMFGLSVALMSVCAALLAYWGLRGNRRFFRWAALTGGLGALFLITPTIIGFSSN